MMETPYKVTANTPFQVKGPLGDVLCRCGFPLSRVAIDLAYQVYDCLECGRLVVTVGPVTRWYVREADKGE